MSSSSSKSSLLLNKIFGGLRFFLFKFRKRFFNGIELRSGRFGLERFFRQRFLVQARRSLGHGILPKVQQALDVQAFRFRESSPKEMAEEITSQTEQFRAVVKANNISLD